jgi:hypothetical protein
MSVAFLSHNDGILTCFLFPFLPADSGLVQVLFEDDLSHAFCVSRYQCDKVARLVLVMARKTGALGREAGRNAPTEEGEAAAAAAEEGGQEARAPALARL